MTQPSEHLTAVTLNIFRLNGILYEWGNRFAAPLGLNTSRWQVLGAVMLSETPPTVPQIAEQFHPDDLAAAARVLGQLGQFYQDK